MRFTTQHETPEPASPLEVLLVFLRLGCTSFGGPAAHLGYFRSEFVERRRWLTETEFAGIVALAQALPGPGSSQTGYAIGLRRAGWLGGLAAWIGFTLPSAALMLAFAFGGQRFDTPTGAAVLHGLQLVAVAVVAQAALAMQRSLAPDRPRLLLAAAAAALVLFGPAAYGTLLAILLGGLAGLALPPTPAETAAAQSRGGSKHAARAAGAAFCLLLAASFLPSAATRTLTTIFLRFYQAGALVFGGGHVVLPTLEAAVVPPGWIGQPAFLAGYGAAQALPGPLFTFAAYLGAAFGGTTSHRVATGLCALAGIFLPGLLLMSAVLPFWSALRQRQGFARALRGVNAGVVGVLTAALIRPVASSSVHSLADLAVVLTASFALTWGKVSPWIVVACTAAAVVVIP